MSYRRASWRSLKNKNQDLRTVRLDYIKFMKRAVKSGYKIDQIDEYVINRSTSPNMAWIEKNKPEFAIKDTTSKSFSVISAISNTNYEFVQVREETTNGIIFSLFIQEFIDFLKTKYGEHFAKIILK